ncbi:MAG TPA: NIL domain-containing protein [Chloroflexota bacterium]|jgi:hypothetical protein
MASTHVKFIYPPELLHQPVVYELGKQFQVVINIRRANVGDTHGCIEMELSGVAQDIDRALDWAQRRGLLIETTAPSEALTLIPA